MRSRRSVVFGVGDIHSRLMFVGEAPGTDEDQQGEPFVGAAGMKLTQIIKAMVPLSEMFGYATDLRSATQGRATYSMEFSRYAEAPSNIAEAVIKRS